MKRPHRIAPTGSRSESSAMNLPALLAGALLASAASLAHAARPLASEDADVLDAGQCEAEGFYSQWHASGFDGLKAWTLQAGCGIGAHTQLALAGSRANSGGEHADALQLAGKTALIARDEGGLGLALAWNLSALRAGGGSFAHEASCLTLAATREMAPGWTAHANLGWTRSEQARMHSTTWGLALEKSLGHGVDLAGEVYGDDRHRPWTGAGLRWAVDAHWSLNAALAAQHDSPRQRLWSLGAKLSF